MRLSTPISKHLRSVATWKLASEYMRDAFRKEMSGRMYGSGPTQQAWHFFYSGWMNHAGVTVGVR